MFGKFKLHKFSFFYVNIISRTNSKILTGWDFAITSEFCARAGGKNGSKKVPFAYLKSGWFLKSEFVSEKMNDGFQGQTRLSHTFKMAVIKLHNFTEKNSLSCLLHLEK